MGVTQTDFRILKEAREKLGLSLEDASSKIQVKLKDGENKKEKQIQTLLEWENCERTPTPNQVEKLFQETYYYCSLCIYAPEMLKHPEEPYIEFFFPENKNTLSPLEKRVLRGFEKMVRSSHITLINLPFDSEWWTTKRILDPRLNVFEIPPEILVSKILNIQEEDILQAVHIGGGEEVFLFLKERIEKSGVFVFCLNKIIEIGYKKHPILDSRFFNGGIVRDEKCPIILVHPDLKVEERILILMKAFMALAFRISHIEAEDVAKDFCMKTGDIINICHEPLRKENVCAPFDNNEAEKQSYFVMWGRPFIDRIYDAYCDDVLDWSDCLHDIGCDIDWLMG